MESRPVRVLVAEDDSISMRVITVTLEKRDFEVIGVQSGQEAIDFLRKDSQVDLIVSDIMMPKVDGFGLLEYVRGNKKTADVPVILCTALHDEKSVVRGISLGANDYIAKPVQSDLLLEKISKILQP